MVVALVFLPVNAFADDTTLLRTVDTPNPQASALFGLVTATGDIDGDGKAEVFIGTPAENLGVNENQGKVYVDSFGFLMGLHRNVIQPKGTADSSGDSTI